MHIRQSNHGAGGSITLKGRMMLSGFLLLAAIILGFAASLALFHSNRELFRSSDAIGYMLCGSGQHVDNVPSASKGTRMICRDAAGVEVSARNNLIAVKMALPFMILFGFPLQMIAWMVAWTRVKR